MNVDTVYLLTGSRANLVELNGLLENPSVYYIIVETEYTSNHITKLTASQKDRGCLHWNAETRINVSENLNKDPKAQKAHIDNNDLFPRLYFHCRSLITEFDAWCKVRDQTIQKITLILEYSPKFNKEFHEEIYQKILNKGGY